MAMFRPDGKVTYGAELTCSLCSFQGFLIFFPRLVKDGWRFSEQVESLLFT